MATTHPTDPLPCRARRAALDPRLASALAILGLCGCTGASASSADAPRSDAPVGGPVAGESVAPVARCASAPTAESTAVRVQLDVPYATSGGDTVRLDIARPSRPDPHPVIVLLHGGGWEGGDRRAMRGEMQLLASRGYAAAAVGYRLTRAPDNVFPAAVQDVRCAVRWLRTRASSLDLDATRIGALGFSAGAHLASMLGVAAAVPALDRAGVTPTSCLAPQGTSAAVQAVVSVAGPQDLRVRGPYTQEQARLVTNFLGVFPGDAPDLAALASPIAHVGPGSAPFLLVHGTRDELVPIEHARRMRDALRGVGVPATLVEVPGGGHSFPALAASDPPTVGCTISAFLDRWLRGS